MKKLIAIASSLIIALTFAACGNDSDKGNDTSMGYGSNNDKGSNIGSDIKDGMSDIGSAAESVTDNMMGDTNNNTNSGNQSADTKISKDEAKAKALKHAGVEEKDIKGFDIDIDRENGKTIYEIDFMSGNTEYSYDIDANSGDIIESDRDLAD